MTTITLENIDLELLKKQKEILSAFINYHLEPNEDQYELLEGIILNLLDSIQDQLEPDTTDGHPEEILKNYITEWIANNLSGKAYAYDETELIDHMIENFSIDDFQGDLTDDQILNNLLDDEIIEFRSL